jgi:hypothetical protein
MFRTTALLACLLVPGTSTDQSIKLNGPLVSQGGDERRR